MEKKSRFRALESVKPCTPSARATGYKPTDAGGVHRRNESKTALDGGKRESKPVRVFLQGKVIYTTFVHGFAGIAKDPPQSASLFIPTNVGIHGGSGGIRTHVPSRTTAFRVRLVTTTSIRFQKGDLRGTGQPGCTDCPVPMEVPPGFEPGNEGFADLCLTTWLWHQIKMER